MRIIAGTLGGRIFESPHGHRTHPMSDKVRGALFNTLGDIDGLKVLDAFAGTGALAFEAMSRGAARAVVIDSDSSAQRTISQNITALGLQKQIKLIKAAAGSWLETTDESFDLVLLDPPYDDVHPKLLLELADRSTIGGVIVISLPPTVTFELGESFKLLLSKSYGDATLVFYRRTK